MTNNSLKYVFLEFTLLFVLMIIVLGSVYIDVVILKNGLPEKSTTELLQSFLILLSISLFFYKMKKEPESTGLFLLLGSLFVIIFIREADYYLDSFYSGAWKVPVVLTLFISLFYGYKNRLTILPSLIYYQGGKAFTYTLIGLLTTIVFSRIFGTQHLWVEIIDNNVNLIKTIIQESLELLGYSLILMGSVSIQFEKINVKMASQKNACILKAPFPFA